MPREQLADYSEEYAELTSWLQKELDILYRSGSIRKFTVSSILARHSSSRKVTKGLSIRYRDSVEFEESNRVERMQGRQSTHSRP